MSQAVSPDVCPACRGLGRVARVPAGGRDWYAPGVNLADWMLPCRLCATEARTNWLEVNSGLEASELGSTLDSFKVLKFADPKHTAQRVLARAMIGRAIENRVGLYTLWGDFGSGKTLALQVIVNEMRRQGLYDGYYASFAAVIDHLRTLFATKQDASRYWDRLLSIPVLALDEVTRFDDQKGWVKDRLFLLVDTRYRMRSTHLTAFATNSNPNAALAPDDAIGYLFSRTREGEKCELRGDVRIVAKR